MNYSVTTSQAEVGQQMPAGEILPAVRLLEAYGRLTDEDWTFLFTNSERLDLPKQYVICAEGTVCQYMYLIISGLVRIRYNKDGRNVTTGFLTDGAAVTPLSSFINQRAATYTVETLEPTILYRLHYDSLRELFRRSHTFEHMARLMTLDSLANLESRLYALQFYTAQERYENFLTSFPGLINRVSLTHLASYLGVSLETLSRIRTNLTNVKQKR